MTWYVDRLPCHEHSEWARHEGFLFSSMEWGELLTCLGATPLFAWNPSATRGLVVPVFRLLGNGVGYLGFPVSGELLDEASSGELRDLAAAISRMCDVCIARVTRSTRIALDNSATSHLPEIRIESLQDWSPQDKKLRKDLSFARRKGISPVVCKDPRIAGSCHALYLATVRRHGGKVRYSREYFSGLLALSAKTDLVRIYTVGSGDDTVDGFAAVVRNGRTAYYLHGAVNDAGRAAGASDLLLEQVVNHAQSLGCESLSLMASPWNQPGLVEFKRKWGNGPGIVATHDIALEGRGVLLRAIARWKGRGDRRMAREWLNGQ